MKISTACIILGIVAVGGYVTYKCYESAKKNENNTPSNMDNANTSAAKMEVEKEVNSTKHNNEGSIDDAINKLEHKKNNIQNDVVQRHEIAAKMIKESMEHILSEEPDAIVSKNSEDLSKIDNALDDLLDDLLDD